MLVFDPPCSVVLFMASGIIVQEVKNLLGGLGLHVVKMHKSFRHCFIQLGSVKEKRKKKSRNFFSLYFLLLFKA
jgi:hypothetical protein